MFNRLLRLQNYIVEQLEIQEKEISRASPDYNIPITLQKFYYPSNKGRVIAGADVLALYLILFGVIDTALDLLFSSQSMNQNATDSINIFITVCFIFDYAIRRAIKGNTYVRSIWGIIDSTVLLLDLLLLFLALIYYDWAWLIMLARIVRFVRLLRLTRYYHYDKIIALYIRKNIPYIIEACKLLVAVIVIFYLIINAVSKTSPESPIGYIFSLILNIPDAEQQTNAEDREMIAIALGVICLMGLNIFAAFFSPIVDRLNNINDTTIKNRLRQSHHVIFVLGDSSILEEIYFSLSNYLDEHITIVIDSEAFDPGEMPIEHSDVIISDPWSSETWDNAKIERAQTLIFVGGEKIDERLIVERMNICGCEENHLKAFILLEEGEDTSSQNCFTALQNRKGFQVNKINLASLRNRLDDIASLPKSQVSQTYNEMLEYLDKYVEYKNRAIDTESELNNKVKIELYRDTFERIISSMELNSVFSTQLGEGISITIRQQAPSDEEYDETLEPLGLTIIDEFIKHYETLSDKVRVDIVYEVRDFRLGRYTERFKELPEKLHVEVFAVEFAISLFLLHEIQYEGASSLWLTKDGELPTQPVSASMVNCFINSKEASLKNILAVKKGDTIVPFVGDYQKIKLEKRDVIISKPEKSTLMLNTP